MEANSIYPSLNIGFVPYLDRLRYTSRSDVEDPISAQGYRIYMEGAGESEIFCMNISPPTITLNNISIRQNNAAFPVHVITNMEVSTFEIQKAYLPAGDDFSSGDDRRLIFVDWIQLTKNARERYRIASYRRNIQIQSIDNTGHIAAEFVAEDCIPVSYVPYSTLDGVGNSICYESIVVQPGRWTQKL